MLLSVSLVFTMYYLSIKPHAGGKIKYYNEMHNEIVIIILCYHMFIFTNFIPNNDIDATFTMGYSFIFFITEILFSNISIMFYKMGL